MKKLLLCVCIILMTSNIVYSGPIRESSVIDRLYEMYENDYRPYRYRPYYDGPGDYIDRRQYGRTYNRDYIQHDIRASIVYNPTGQWVFINNGWHFQFTNGAYATNCWLLQGDKWYYLDARSIMAVGFCVINGNSYYFNPDGTMVVGTVILNGITHFFDNNGIMIY